MVSPHTVHRAMQEFILGHDGFPSLNEVKAFRARFIQNELGLHSRPYNEDEAIAAAKSSKHPKKKWVPHLRYVKDKFGIPSSHSGKNRAARRAETAAYRNGFTDGDGIYHQGSRSRSRRKAHLSGRPVRWNFH
jgi:hypothetical protein